MFGDKISVIVPIYNAEQYLNACLDSIVLQTYENLEIILIDDGSTDRSLSICQEYALRDNRIRWYHYENAGLSVSRQRGYSVATGVFVTFVDADDYIDCDTYFTIMNSIDDILPDIVLYDLVEEYPEDSVIKRNHYTPGLYGIEWIRDDLWNDMLSYGTFFDFGVLPNLVCKLIRRQFLMESDVFVSKQVFVGEDADLTFQLLAQAESVQFVDFAPYHYCKRNDSMMWRAVCDAAIELLYQDLYNSFVAHGCWNKLEKQLKEYITFIRLLKNPKSVKEVNTIFAKANFQIVLYGAGGFGQALYSQYGNRIVGWIDKNYEKYIGEGLPVISLEQFLERKYEYNCIYISILNMQICKQIQKELVEVGIEGPITFFGQ